MPGRLLELRMNSGPSAASRTAAVASRSSDVTFMLWASVAKRFDVGQRHLDARRVEPAGGVEATRQAAQHLFV
jgi:hypothetical protein